MLCRFENPRVFSEVEKRGYMYGGQGNLTVDMELGFSLQRMGFVYYFTALFVEGVVFCRVQH